MNEKKHFLLLALAAVVCLAFFPACSDGSDSGSGSVVGTWATQDGIRLEFHSDGDFVFTGLKTNPVNGTYEVSGSTVTLTPSELADIIVLTLSGNTLTGTVEENAYTFTRQ